LFLFFVACHTEPPLPTPGCDPGTPGLAQATSRPLAVLGDRVSDRLELYTVDPFMPAGCIGVDENPKWIDEPFDLASFGDALYVVLGHADNYTSGTLRKIHLPDGAVVGEVPIGEQPSLIALSADGKRAYITLFRNLQMLQGPWTKPGAVVSVDTDAMKVLGTSPDLCNAGLGIALDETRSRVWAACAGSDQLAIVDMNDLSLQQMVTLNDGMGNDAGQPAYIVLDGNHAFITAQASGDLWILDQETTALVTRIGFGNDAFPQRLSLVPNSNALLVAVDYLSTLAVIDTQALVVADKIPVGLLRPQGIAVTADSHWALVTDEHDLVHPGHLLKVDLTGLGAGGGRLDSEAPAAVFPQAVIVLP
jgi:DNA-binding beta-propeller fold protein YncE